MKKCRLLLLMVAIAVGSGSSMRAWDLGELLGSDMSFDSLLGDIDLASLVNEDLGSALSLIGITGSKANSMDRIKQIFSMEMPGYWDFGGGSGLFTLNTGIYTSDPTYSGFTGGGFSPIRALTAKNISTFRAALGVLQAARANSAATVNDTITPIFDEHLLLMADRVADTELNYTFGYSNELKCLGDTIATNLFKVMKVSKGKMRGEVDYIQHEYDMILAQVKYLRKAGADVQIENEKRREGFESCRDQLSNLVETSKSLYLTATSLNNLVGF